MTNDRVPQSSSARAGSFATTRWSVVLEAGRGSSPDSRRALATLCETYWYPLYAYVRRCGYQVAESQDLTQEFFSSLLEQERLRVADQQRGKFRSFLLASLKNFLANQWRAARAQKRGAGRVPLSLDWESGESRYRLEPASELTAERVFLRRWALTLLEQTLSRLAAEYEAAGKRALFDKLKVYLGGESDRIPYSQVAAELSMTAGAVKVASHRLRRRCREVLRDEITHTVATPEEVDDELRELFAALSVT